MKMTFTCETCNSSFLVDEKLSGRVVRCKRCGQATRILSADNSPSRVESTYPIVPLRPIPRARYDFTAKASKSSSLPLSLKEICADFLPNPFALPFYFEIDNEIDLATSYETDADEKKLIHLKEFKRRRVQMNLQEEKKQQRVAAERSKTASPSVNELIATLIDEQK